MFSASDFKISKFNMLQGVVSLRSTIISFLVLLSRILAYSFVHLRNCDPHDTGCCIRIVHEMGEIRDTIVATTKILTRRLTNVHFPNGKITFLGLETDKKLGIFLDSHPD